MANEQSNAEKLQQSAAKLHAALAALNGPTAEVEKRAAEQAAFPNSSPAQARFAAGLKLPH